MKTGLEIASDLEKQWEDMSFIEKCMAIRKCPECGERLLVFQQPSLRLSCSSKKCHYMLHVEISDDNREVYQKWAKVTTSMTIPPTLHPLKKTSFFKR